MNTLEKLLAWLGRYTSATVIAAAAVAYIFPIAFAWVSGITQTLILGIIMLTMGLTLTANDFRILASRPWDIAVGTIAQYTIMPCVAWLLSHVLGLDTSLTLGIVLVGCCPGGVSSNIMSFLCRGDVAFSVGMTTVSTLLAPFATPLLVLLLAGQSVQIDTIGMFINILIVTILPIAIGYWLNSWLGGKKQFARVQRSMPGVSVAGLACIVGGVVCSVHPFLANNAPELFAITFAAVLMHNGIGYAIGYAVGILFGFGKAKKRTISIEVGMQNAGLATNLASNFFMATNPLAVVPCALSCAWHSISGTLLAGYFAQRDRKMQH